MNSAGCVLRPHAAAHARPTRVVRFANLAVVALLGEVADTAREAEALGRQVLHLAGHVAEMDVGELLLPAVSVHGVVDVAPGHFRQ